MIKQLFVALSVFAFAAGAALVPQVIADEPAAECEGDDCPADGDAE